MTTRTVGGRIVQGIAVMCVAGLVLATVARAQDFDEDDAYDQAFPEDPGGPIYSPPIGGAAVDGAAVGIGDPSVGGPAAIGPAVGVGDAPVQGPAVDGAAVGLGDAAVGGPSVGGAAVGDAPIEGEPLY